MDVLRVPEQEVLFPSQEDRNLSLEFMDLVHGSRSWYVGSVHVPSDISAKFASRSSVGFSFRETFSYLLGDSHGCPRPLKCEERLTWRLC